MMGLFTSHSVLLGRMRIEADGRLPLLLPLLVVLVAGASLAGRGRSGICVIVGVSSLESALEARDMPCGGGGSDGIMAPSDAVDSGNVLLLLLVVVVVVIVVAVVIADFFVYFFPTSRPVWTLSFCLSFVLGPSLIPVPPHEGMYPILNKMLWYRSPKV